MNTSLKPGTYRLTQDVKNPRPDGRVGKSAGSWDRWPIWEKDSAWIVEEHPERPNQTRLYLRGGHSYLALPEDSQGYMQLEPSLTLHVESPSDYLRRVEGDLGAGRVALELLDYMMTTKVVIVALLAELNADKEGY